MVSSAREARVVSALSVTAFALLVGLAPACGGGNANGPGAATPSETSSSSGGTAPKEASVPDTPPAGPPKDVDCGDFTTCAVASDGAAHCWGRDKGGELGDGATGARMKRGIVPGIGKVKKIALGSQFGCALLEDKKVKCWGTGRIANDGKVWSDAKPMVVAGVNDAEELVASGVIACARSASGVVCWGADEKTIGTPPRSTFKQIAAGFTHACGLDEKGAVQCWGPGDWGGNGAFAKPPVTGAQQVVTGDRHGCVVTKDKKVECWGTNDAGQLGTKPDIDSHKKMVPVAGLTNVARLIAGEASTCALMTDGSAKCWGANGEGELGLGTRSSDERPTKSSVSDVEQLCIASQHGCALTKQGKLYCWGANAFGQLGDGTKERRQAPTPVVW